MSVEYYGPLGLDGACNALGISWYDRVTEIHLTGHNYSDAVVEHIVRLRRLRSISLVDTQISEDGVVRLAAALRDCQITLNGREF